MPLTSEFPEGVTDPTPPNHCTKQPNQQHPPPPGTGKQEEQQAAFFPEQFWQLHRFPGNINNYPAIWNQPWAGQQKVSPRLCSISATLCKCRKYQGGGTVGQSPPGCRAVSPSLALTSCQRPSSLDPSKGCFSQPCLQCRDRAAPNQELLPGLSPFPGHRRAFKVLKENHRQEQTPHSIILHFSSFYSFICTAIFYRTH